MDNEIYRFQGILFPLTISFWTDERGLILWKHNIDLIIHDASSRIKFTREKCRVLVIYIAQRLVPVCITSLPFLICSFFKSLNSEGYIIRYSRNSIGIQDFLLVSPLKLFWPYVYLPPSWNNRRHVYLSFIGAEY